MRRSISQVFKGPTNRPAGVVVFGLTCGLGLVLMIAAPVFGWLPVVRVSAVLAAALLTAILAVRPWSWTGEQWARTASWTPSREASVWALALLSAVLWWLVVSRFQAGGIAPVDFTVYFDRPLYQTSLGRPLFVESTDDPRFAHLTHLAVHGYWLLLPLAAFYRIHPSPLWLLSLSVAAVIAGAVYVFRIVERTSGTAAVATAAAFAFAFDGNTARALNYGFHPEILYAWFVPWAMYAALRRARIEFILVVLACLLVKEDAVFPLFALSTALTFVEGRAMAGRDRAIFLVAPPVLALVNLVGFYLWIVPRLSPNGQVMYSYFWATAGATPYAALVWLLKHPVHVVSAALTSGFFTLVLVSHWYLPVLGWRWMVGLLPLVLVYAVSDSDQIRGFGIYYALPLIPFLTIGTAAGARRLVSWFGLGPRSDVASALIVVATALSTGLGYSLRPWKHEFRAIPEALARLQSFDQVLVQGELYPHAGYEEWVQLLTPHDIRAAVSHRAAILLGRRGSTYPLKTHEWRCLTALPPVASMPGGLLAIRVTPEAADCVDEHH